MNFVLICVDTLRYDHLSCNGNDWIKTPNLAALAEESVVFDNAYAGSLMTIPMRTDVIRGRFGTPFHPWWPLGFDWPTLPQVLGQAGWATMLVCDTPHLINGAHGFDWPFHAWHFERGSEVDRHIIDDADVIRSPKYWPHYTPAQKRVVLTYMRDNRHRFLEQHWQAPRTLAFAGDFIERNRRREKFFLWVDTFELHEPWTPPEHYVALYDDPGFDADNPLLGLEPVELLGEAEIRHARAHYAAEVTMLDRHIGRFLDRLADTGRDRDTTVILTSDHGTNLGAHGTLGKGAPWYEQIAHEVLMIRMPGVKPGRRQGIVQPGDLMPTILEAAGTGAPETCQGRSLLPTLTGEQDGGRDVAVTGSSHLNGGVAVQDTRWCLLDYPERDRRELYDKRSDRAQEHNVISQHPEESMRLHEKLLAFLRDHEAHPGLVEAFETGKKGDAREYFPCPDFLRGFKAYWNNMLDPV